jgi:transcriptional regulator with XRE-family HTH domain
MIGTASDRLRRRLGEEIARSRLDQGFSQSTLARAAGIDRSHLSRIERGVGDPSLETLVALSLALGTDLAVRLYPNTGSPLRDRHQAGMADAFLAALHERWRPWLEVPVRAPTRGLIDLVLEDHAHRILVATELESTISRLEQHLRWAHEKADALRSAAAWPNWARDGDPGIERLLVLRSSRANRALIRTFETLFRTEFPARTADAIQALTTTDAVWPGPAIVWVEVGGGASRLLTGPPRGVSVGR